MAEKHPYVSGSSGIIQAITQLRKQFPGEVSSDTLKKLGIAPNNETYIINILRFIGVIDSLGKKNADAGAVFTKHEDAEFQKGFSKLVEKGYKDLFGLHGAAAWNLQIPKLISFFRGADQTSALVGQRQANTFQTLAGLAGYSALPEPKAKNALPKNAKTTAAKKVQGPKGPLAIVSQKSSGADSHIGLTVRVEINLPATGDQDTYDKIFKSIRENLLRG